LTAPASPPTAEQIERWLIAAMADCLRRPATELDADLPFAEQGLDSVSAVSISGDLGAWLGRSLEPTLAWDYPSARQLARHLAASG
jgi:acyl carrier protein